jgi:hypothetical protein
VNVQDLPGGRRQQGPALNPRQALAPPPKGNQASARRQPRDGVEEGLADDGLVKGAERRVEQDGQGQGAIRRALDQLTPSRSAANVGDAR